MKHQIHTELTAELRSEWEDLWRANPSLATAFNSPVWVVAAQTAFGTRDIRIITVRQDDGRLVGVAALAQDTVHGLRVFAAPARQYADKPPILIDWEDAAAVTSLAAALKSIRPVYLSYCRAPIRNALQKVAPVTSFQDDQNAIVDFTNGYQGDLSKEALAKIRKRIAKSEKPVTMRHSKTAHSELLKDAYHVERVSTKSERGMAEFASSHVRTFFETIAAQNPDLIHVSLMDIGGQPVAYSVDFLAHGVYQGSQKAYARGYEYFQPGKYLVLKLLEYNAQAGYQAFDFGRGYDNFKLQFTKNVQPVYSVIVANRAAGTYLSLTRALRQRVYESVVQNRALYKTFKSIKSRISR